MKIIKIGAIWCPACLIMNSVINKIKDNYDMELIEYDYDIDNDIVNTYNVGKILPVFIFLDNKDNELERIIGEKKYQEIEEIINRYS